MSDTSIRRFARSGQDLDHLASMIDDATIEIASTGGRWFDETATRGHWGREAENFIRGSTGKSKRLDAPVAGGKFRIVDDYVAGPGGVIVNEVKTGDGKLDRRLRTQIDKDAHLVGTGAVADYTWNFFPSGRSNRVGPEPALLAELKSKGLKVKVWLP